MVQDVSRPELTVAVTTCGRPAALRRCLACLARSTSRPKEVIVVDQAPTEESRAVTAEFGGIRHLEQSRLGLSAGRNLALEEAASHLLAVTDDDCLPDERWVEALEAALQDDPFPAAVTGPILPPLGPQPAGMHELSIRRSAERHDFRGRVVPWRAGSGANLAAPVELLRSIGGWDQRLGTGTRGRAAEDAELLYRILAAGLTVRYEPRAVVRHEWQSRQRRLATDWSYGFGVGAMCGIVLRRGDLFALRMLASWLRLHLAPIPRGALTGETAVVVEHGRALLSVPAGLLYGVRVGDRVRTWVADQGLP